MKTWHKNKLKGQYQRYTSDWYWPDGDPATVIVSTTDLDFTLSCFSGIGASRIFIDRIDFEAITNKVPDFDYSEPFEMQCLRIADYLCSKFCE